MTPFEKLIELWPKVIIPSDDNKVVIYDSTSYKNLLSRPIAATVSEDDLQEAYKLLIDDGEHQWEMLPKHGLRACFTWVFEQANP